VGSSSQVLGMGATSINIILVVGNENPCTGSANLFGVNCQIFPIKVLKIFHLPKGN